jgi:rubrerythrin
MPADTIQTLFSKRESEVAGVASATGGEKDAIQTAMEMETASFELYGEAAGKASDEKTKQLFERLSEEENQHYRMLENTLQYLEDNQEWFLWTEGGLLTGDMSSLGQG